MFDIGWGELVVIGVVALIAIGPKELPGVLRTVGVWMGKIRRMASEFQDQFRDAMREAEMADLKKQVDEMTSTASGYTNFDPIGTVRKEIEGVMNPSPASTPAPDAPPAEPAAQLNSAEAPASAAPEGLPETAPSSADAPSPAETRKGGEGA